MEESTSLFDMFREGGWMMWVIVLLTAAALPTTIAALVGNNRALAMVGLVLVAAIALAGVGGTMLGRRQVDEALAYVADAHDRELIREGGYRESARNLQFAGLVGVPLMLLAVGAYARAMQKES